MTINLLDYDYDQMHLSPDQQNPNNIPPHFKWYLMQVIANDLRFFLRNMQQFNDYSISDDNLLVVFLLSIGFSIIIINVCSSKSESENENESSDDIIE